MIERERNSSESLNEDPDVPVWLDRVARYHTDEMDGREAVDFLRDTQDDERSQAALEALDRTRWELWEYGQQTAEPVPHDLVRRFSRSVPSRGDRVGSHFSGATALDSDSVSENDRTSPTRSRRLNRFHWESKTARRRVVSLCLAAALGAAATLVAVLFTVSQDVPDAPGDPAAAPDTPLSPGLQTVSMTFPPDVGEIPLVVSDVESRTGSDVESATVYFGRLDAIASALLEQGAPIDRRLLATNPDLCVETAVVTGLPDRVGAVYADGLTGWSAAEGEPPKTATQDLRSIHQQLIIPPDTLRPGTLTSSIRVVSDSVDRRFGPFDLTLVSQDGSRREWDVAGKTVFCRTLS